MTLQRVRKFHCTIHLPVNDNAGQPISPGKLVSAVREASEFAGGCFLHSEGVGHWFPPEGGLQIEPMKPLEVIVPATRRSLAFLHLFQKKLAKVLRQCEIFLYYQVVWVPVVAAPSKTRRAHRQAKPATSSG